MSRPLAVSAVGVLLLTGACEARPAGNVADTLPQLLSDAVPFRYPMALYDQGIEGDVTLRLHVDSLGSVVVDSVRVERSSGQPLLDSAAMSGAAALQFRPARLGGRAVPLTVLFPVKFRVPPPPAVTDTTRAPER
jgi:TonB family protein